MTSLPLWIRLITDEAVHLDMIPRQKVKLKVTYTGDIGHNSVLVGLLASHALGWQSEGTPEPVAPSGCHDSARCLATGLGKCRLVCVCDHIT